MITHGLCGYSGVMTSWCFYNSSCGWSPLTHRCLRRIWQSFDGVVPWGSALWWWFQVVPISCRRCLNHRIVVVWHIETFGAICSPQAGLQHIQCPFSANDVEALTTHSLLEWSLSAMSMLQVITDAQMRGLITPNPTHTTENVPVWVYIIKVT